MPPSCGGGSWKRGRRAPASAFRRRRPTPTASATARATTCPGWWSTCMPTPRPSRSRRWRCRCGARRSTTRWRPSASRGAVEVVENGIALEVEPLGGQKTGMFIDQRETRARVASLARGARVLDCYAYAGGFALAAARGGAAAVTAVDSSARAVARINAHAERNGVAIEAIEADVFRYLETATPRAFD